ncbi:MAG: TRAP transporter small permease [Oscillospiraceae bacterium]|nr:TRAP transporter small permease [Oscillospiraceae bacterium]
MTNTFTKVTDKICEVVSWFGMFTVFLLMILICLDVVMTKLGRPIAGMYEVSCVLLSTLVFFSWAYTQVVHGHIHVVMFVSKMPRVLRFISFGLTSILSAVVMGIASYAIIGIIKIKYQTGECTGTLLIPYWPFYIVEFVAFLLMTVVLARDAIKAVMAIGDKEMAEEVQSTWV